MISVTRYQLVTRYLRIAAGAGVCLALSACALLTPRPAGIGPMVAWSDLPGWRSGAQAGAWNALLKSCDKLQTRTPAWAALCTAARAAPQPDDAQAREFFRQWFQPHVMIGERGKRQGLITGYYEPLLHGSLVRTARYRYPIYRRPADLLTVDLGSVYPELAGKRVRGRLEGDRVVPFFSREDIHGDEDPLAGDELMWVDDPVALFFLHIQGSGRVQLTNGRIVKVGYADQNGYPYTSIGRELVHMGALTREDVSLFTIEAWLRAHPDQAETLFNTNASYVFFKLLPADTDGPLGSLNVPLTPQRSIAVDKVYVPLGFPVWLDTTVPGSDDQPYRRLVLAQDTGGAIAGAVRADLFWGAGDKAERMAGEMKQPGRLYLLVPKLLTPQS